MKARLHLYPHSGPGTRGYIVGEPSALRSLARHLEDTARGLAGFDTIQAYGSDGHEYELVLACDVTEEEWQNLPLPAEKQSNPAQLSVVRTFDELKQAQSNK